MNKFNKKQVITVIAAVVLVIILYSLRTVPTHKKTAENTVVPTSSQFEMNTYIDQKKKLLEEAEEKEK